MKLELVKRIWYAINPVLTVIAGIVILILAVTTTIGGWILVCLCSGIFLSFTVITLIGYVRDRWRRYSLIQKTRTDKRWNAMKD